MTAVIGHKIVNKRLNMQKMTKMLVTGDSAVLRFSMQIIGIRLDSVQISNAFFLNRGQYECYGPQSALSNIRL